MEKSETSGIFNKKIWDKKMSKSPQTSSKKRYIDCLDSKNISPGTKKSRKYFVNEEDTKTTVKEDTKTEYVTLNEDTKTRDNINNTDEISIYGIIAEVKTVEVFVKSIKGSNFIAYEIMTNFQLGTQEFTKTKEKSKKGTYGVVFFYQCAKPGFQLAVKYFDDQKEARNEEMLMNAINQQINQETPRCDVIPGRPYSNERMVCIVMERADTLKNGKTPDQAKLIVNAVARQILCLSRYKWNNVTCFYTDLKPYNILEKNGKVMLGDLGSIIPYSESDPVLYASTHLLPTWVTGTGHNQEIAAREVRICIAYLLAMLEVQIQVPTEEYIDMYMEENWWENLKLIRAIQEKLTYYLRMFVTD